MEEWCYFNNKWVESTDLKILIDNLVGEGFYSVPQNSYFNSYRGTSEVVTICLQWTSSMLVFVCYEGL